MSDAIYVLCWQAEGRERGARELLTPIYAWYSEGHATADLQQASTLLAKCPSKFETQASETAATTGA